MSSSPDYGRLSDALMHWSEFHEFVRSKPHSWDAADLLLESAKKLDVYAQERLKDALICSAEALSPLGEPLNLNMGKHRWLSSDREESYSDWLAWILQGFNGTEILDRFGISDETSSWSGKIGVRREVWSKDKHSRTDIEVLFGERDLLIIEVKVQIPGSELQPELERFERASREYVGHRFLILLGIEEPAPEVQLSGFVFVDWRTLCQRLRQYACRLKAIESELLRAAAILIFCGAVEQNLFGFSLKPRLFHAAATVDYLCEWGGVMMNNEKSDKKKDFLIKGARTYIDVDDAMTEFRRLVQDQCLEVVKKRLDDLNYACGMDWKQYQVKNYLERKDDYFYCGKQLAVGGLGGVYFCLRIKRDGNNVLSLASVFLYRKNRNLASELWHNFTPTSGTSCSGHYNLFFERHMLAENIPDFAIHLDEAINDFNEFIHNNGGLKKYRVSGSIDDDPDLNSEALDSTSEHADSE
uniref:PD-(D/E)XK nuclease superfamily protein n=1 Tax=mine drainage metagenome TaxID=410659 RepID=E6PWY7_9ZZZZ